MQRTSHLLPPALKLLVLSALFAGIWIIAGATSAEAHEKLHPHKFTAKLHDREPPPEGGKPAAGAVVPMRKAFWAIVEGTAASFSELLGVGLVRTSTLDGLTEKEAAVPRPLLPHPLSRMPSRKAGL